MSTTNSATRLFLDRTRQASPQVLEHLRRRILTLELAPGTTLSRLELQKQFGLSQTPVRDALLRLEEEGLVAIFPQHATIVSMIDIEAARQAHFMRRAIESDAVRMLAGNKDIEAAKSLRRANSYVARAASENHSVEFLEADRVFHRTIFEHAGILGLWPIMQRQSGDLDRLRMLDLPNIGMERVVTLHTQIVEGIEAADPEAAANSMREHLSRTLAMFDRAARDYPAFVKDVHV